MKNRVFSGDQKYLPPLQNWIVEHFRAIYSRSTSSWQRVWPPPHGLLGTRHEIQPLNLLEQKVKLLEGLAAVARPMNLARLIDQNRRMQFHLFEIVVGLEAPGICKLDVREQPKRQLPDLE